MKKKRTHNKIEEILQIFRKLSQIPRCSEHEEQIRQWLLTWAKERHLEAEHDAVGNVLIKVPASHKSYKKSKPVIIQGHMDMVCEKLPESLHDFTKEPIECVIDDGWLRANGTTLGADNGIAIAIGLALAEEKKAKHPPLELLYTVQEEVGLTGANELQPDFLSGRILLNLDSEEEGTFIVGCAGGKNTTLHLPLVYQDLAEQYRPYRILAGGMKGGHSGADINAQRANAIHMLCRGLEAVMTPCDVRVSFIHGGTVGNAIPRDAHAIVFLPEEHIDRCTQVLADIASTLQTEYRETDPALRLTFEPYVEIGDRRAMTAECGKKAVDFLLAIPHGVAAMSTDIEGLVDTSNNLATVTVIEGKLNVLTSQRSAVFSRLLAHTNRIEAIARLAGGEAHSTQGYPAWQADWDSPLIEVCRKVYKKLFKTRPAVTILHAGLECGLIGAKCTDMDMISFGPTIRDPHSPGERIEIASIGRVWNFLVTLLKALK